MRTGLPRAAAVALLAVVASGPLAAQEADTAAVADTFPVPSDTVARPGDTLAAPGDTAGADADTAGRSLRDVREGLAGGAFPSKDSVFEALAERQGFRIVEYRAEEVVLQVPDRVVRLRDSAQVNYGQAALVADSIVYRSLLQFMNARGRIRLLSPDQQEMTSDSVLYYDVSNLKGTVLGARTSFAQGGTTWSVTGDAIPVGQNTLYVETGTFSSCTLEEPHYYFKANQIKMVTRDVIVAWPVVLYISEVPVFWLPFFAQDIRPDRRSGIVPPQFGFNTVVSTSDNVERQVTDAGFYWAIDRFMDARFTVDWFAGQWTELSGDFRYNVLKDFLEGSVTVAREFSHRPDRGDNLRVRFDHEQRLTPNTRISADGEFVRSERLLRERSFDATTQTQTIDTDVGIRHDTDFASVSLSGRRQQFLGTEGRVDLVLPSVDVSLSPVTLFPAPRNRAGLFNNLTWRGSAGYSRQESSRDRGDDRLTTNGRLNQSFSLGRLSLSANGSFRQVELDRLRILPPEDTASADTAFVELDPTLETTADWSSSADFQVELPGSTTLRPTVDVSGGWFRARTPPDSIRGDTVPDTNGEFVQTPTRLSAGASLSTDLFGFFPGFGSFERIRHKISPRFRWRYRPEVTLQDTSLASIPGFPGGTGAAQNELTVSLNQTFEAKVPAGGGGGGPEAARDTAGAARDTAGFPSDTMGLLPDTTVVDSAAFTADSGRGAGRAAAGGPGQRSSGAGQQGRERTVTLLSIRSDALRFDFERAKMGEPVLVTDRWGNSLSSDFLRGLSLNVTHDLFEGTGADRTFSPFLTQVNASFSLASGQSLGDLIGLGGQGGGTGVRRRRPSEGFQRGREQETDAQTGRWNLSLRYSLSRSREGETTGFGSQDSQSLQWNLRLQPTPNWRMSWGTNYNITDGEFGSQRISMTRDLHRWRAEFEFSQAPSGNFFFSLLVRLTDAPDLKVPYQQRSD